MKPAPLHDKGTDNTCDLETHHVTYKVQYVLALSAILTLVMKLLIEPERRALEIFIAVGALN
jgi:hypothetical protein